MKVNITIDSDKVDETLTEDGTFVDPGLLPVVIEAVIANLEFSFDREEAEVGKVIQFPGVSQ